VAGANESAVDSVGAAGPTSGAAAEPPLVSVILPAFNRPRCLREAVASVLEQTVSDWELVIADDGSGPETASYLRSLRDPRLTVLWLQHCGNPGRVRNAAMQVARGRYLAFLDSDDCWAAQKLEKQLALLRSAPDRRWCYTAIAHVDEDGHPSPNEERAPWIPYQGDILASLLDFRAQVATPTVLAERTLVKAAGGFDESLLFCEHLDLWMRLAKRSPVAVVDEPLVRVRDQRDRYSTDRAGDYEGQVLLFGKMVDTLADPGLRAIARRRRAIAGLVLAGIHVDAGRRIQVWRTLGQAARFSWRYPDWWWRAGKTATRAMLPTPLLAHWRSFQRSQGDS
jgi:glycosyltransferase involved in cell wall biosynthesis